jgi:proteic killer suppression protein
MIRSFRNKELANLWAGNRTRIDRRFHKRILERLDALDAASSPENLNIPGWDFHGLQGKPKRYTVHVNGPWCITFEFESGDAWRVDFEQYH